MKATSIFIHRAISLLFLALAFVLSNGQASAQQITINFNGLQNQEFVSQYYNGGGGSLGSSPGFDYGVTFTPINGARVSKTIVAGQSVLFMSNLNPNSDLEPLTMNVQGGFSAPFSFQYAMPSNILPGSVTIYDGPNGTGNILATQSLPEQDGTPLYDASSTTPVVLSFVGTGRSVVFLLDGGAADLDNITYSITPVPGLSSLSTSAGTLYPSFNTNVTSYGIMQVLSDDVTATTVTASPNNPMATMQVSLNGGAPITLVPGTPSPALTFNACNNVINVHVVTPGAETMDYRINIMRAGCIQGAQGPPGPPGPAGTNSNAHTSEVYVIPESGSLTITDARVTNKSIILFQYVGGGLTQPVAAEVTSGKIEVVGLPNKRFRYVVFN